MRLQTVALGFVFSIFMLGSVSIEAWARDEVVSDIREVKRDGLCREIKVLFESGKWRRHLIKSIPYEKSRGVRYEFDLNRDARKDYLSADYPGSGVYAVEPKYTLQLSGRKGKKIFYVYGRESFIGHRGKYYLIFSVIHGDGGVATFTNPFSIIEIADDDLLLTNCAGGK